MDRRKLLMQIRAILAFGWLNGIVAAKRNPLWVLSYIIAPISFLVLIKIFARQEMLGFALVGGVLMTLASNGIGLMGDTVFYKNTIKLQDMLVASPLNPLAYLGGLMLSGIFFAVPGLIIFWILLFKYGLMTVGNFIILTIISFITAIPLAGLGFTIATFVKEERFVWPLSGILTFLLSVLPPVYYPSIILPSYLGKITMFIPTSAGAALFHLHTGLLQKTPINEVFIWLILLLEGTILLIITLYRSRWREK